MYLLRYFLKLVHETLYKNKTKQQTTKKKQPKNTSALSLYFSHFCF